MATLPISSVGSVSPPQRKRGREASLISDADEGSWQAVPACAFQTEEGPPRPHPYDLVPCEDGRSPRTTSDASHVGEESEQDTTPSPAKRCKQTSCSSSTPFHRLHAAGPLSTASSSTARELFPPESSSAFASSEETWARLIMAMTMMLWMACSVALIWRLS